jgi:malonate transporter and related proteins
MVPLLNVLALGVLVRYAGGPKLDFIQMLRALFVNPFIWSPAIGLTLNGTAVDLPQALLSYIDILGRASLAAGLLVVGVERPSTCVGWPSRRLSMCSRWL